jgi:hypothetical protein
MQIRNPGWKKVGSGIGINIPDPQHCILNRNSPCVLSAPIFQKFSAHHFLRTTYRMNLVSAESISLDCTFNANKNMFSLNSVPNFTEATVLLRSPTNAYIQYGTQICTVQYTQVNLGLTQLQSSLYKIYHFTKAIYFNFGAPASCR